MICITGDTHGDFKRFSKKALSKRLALTEEDYIIVCGDLGLCWERGKTFEYNCDFFAAKAFTLLWVQGNHENYNMIEEYPLEEWHGGMVRHIVRDKVILLERGQVFELDGKKFFTFGGASSHDIQGGVLNRNDCDYDDQRIKAIRSGLPFRILNESWWKQELPTEVEMAEGMKNLQKHDFKVDYVISHCCATSVQNMLDKGPGHIYEADVLTDYFDTLEEKLNYRRWFFGHYHMDREVDERHTLLYYDIIPLEESGKAEGAPVPGRPRFRLGEYVVFDRGKEENCIYKHIVESGVRKAT